MQCILFVISFYKQQFVISKASMYISTYIHFLVMNDALHNAYIDKHNYKQEQITKIKIELRIKKEIY